MLWMAALVLGLASWASPARAQVEQPPPFFVGTLEEAIEKSKKEHKVLVVFMSGIDREVEDGFDKVRSHTLMNRSLQQWLTWHAVLVEVQYAEEPARYQAIERQVGVPRKNVAKDFNMRRDPYFVVIRNGRFEKVFPKPYLAFGEDPLWGRYHMGYPESIRLDMTYLSDRHYIKPLELLLNLSTYLDGLSATEPAWAEMHAAKNPPPPAPARVMFSLRHDENGAAWPAPPDPAKGDQAPAIWEAITIARANAHAGDRHLATGVYTWLWERMDENRPWMKPLRRLVIADEMKELARTREGSMARFTQMHEDASGRYAWSTLVERLDWVITGEIINDVFTALIEFDYSINDRDEGSLLTTTENQGLSLLGARTPWSEIGVAQRVDLQRLDSLRASLDLPRAARATETEWAALNDLRREVLLLETCRVHVASLGDGRVDEAMRVVEPLLKVDTDGSARLALAAVAWGAGVADARHGAWVSEAVEMGADDAGLGEAIRAARPASPSDSGG
jgi:hypothetical protein